MQIWVCVDTPADFSWSFCFFLVVFVFFTGWFRVQGSFFILIPSLLI